MTTREITGKHVLIGMVAAFGVIVTVNLTMAYQAIGTFPGLETKNSYVSSQSFDARRAAQLALGWEADAGIADGVLTVTLTDALGQPVQPETMTALLGRPTVARDDRFEDLVWTGSTWEADAVLAEGAWVLKLQAVSADGVEFAKRISLWVR